MLQVDLQMEGAINGGSEQANSSSEDAQFVVAPRKMMRKEIEAMMIRTAHRLIGSFEEDLILKVVNEEIQSFEEKLSTFIASNHANETARPRQRSLLQLKFLDEISGHILTGKEIKGKGGNHMQVALVDNTTGRVVNCGPESSAKVEILVLDASDDGNEHILSSEDFNKKIIKEGDKKKPHFTKSYYIYLDKGEAFLPNAKLGHGSSWMRSCNCRLGARIVGNLRGIEVQEGLTEPFNVLDSRSKLYENHYPPSLSDPIWRVENIGKDGPRHKRLNEKNVFTVGDFLFLHSIDPQRLQKIVRAGTNWEATVDHARTCSVDDERIYLYCPSSESKMGVTFDVVGRLKGLIHESGYVPVNSLSANEKDRANELLLSAFENRNDITVFKGENSLDRHQSPSRTNNNDASTSSSIQEGTGGSDLILSENIDDRDSTEVGPASRDAMNMCSSGESSSDKQMYNPYYMAVPSYEVVSPGQFSDDLDRLLQYFKEDENLMSVCFPESQNELGRESHCRQRESTIVAIICVVRASMRFMASIGLRLRKRRRI